MLSMTDGRKPDDRHPSGRESRLLTDRGTADRGVGPGSWCRAERDRPEAPTVPGPSVPVPVPVPVSVPVSIAGVGLCAIGAVNRRTSAHAQAMREPGRLADTTAA
ncbi:hypothetical protein ACFQ8C_01250 [Streptomyces sp. NPDC056503]|uniref:hypothetical protein n=1 Tax=Streptomyces sp. NPDC056503 TaxID=3345842 RepID=UPI0036951F38